MKKMTDRELTDRIRQVFDHYEDSSSSSDGWKSLRKKYPASQQKPVNLWWTAAAAVLLVAGGIWFSMPDHLNPDHAAISNKPPLAETAPAPRKNRPAVLPDASPYTESEPEAGKMSSHTAPVAPVISSYHHPADTSPADALMNEADQPLLTSVPVQETEVNTLITDARPDSSARLASQDPDPASRPQTLSGPFVPAGPVHSENLSGPDNRFDPPATEDKNRKEQIFSVYAGSFFNYADGSEMKLNFGAGLTSDIRIGPNLRLTTGISMAQNTLSYKNGLPSAKSEILRYASPSPGYGSGQLATTVRTITNYDASLLSLDIPVSLKYMIIPKENRLYVSAGLVSGTYLAETYVLNYRNYSIASGTFVSQTKGEEIRKEFQSFDLARTLNLSFGFNTPLSRSQTISVEPFIRYPLGGLGSENLKFGSSGINLRLNFSPLKN